MKNNDKTTEFLQKLVDQATKQAVESTNDPNLVDLEIDELLVNEMRTKAGNDFFDLFNSKWSWPDADGDFIIIFTERPFRTNTTQLRVFLNDLVILENFLQPRSTYLEELSDYAVSIATQYIQNYRQLVEDLESADQSGSGIY